MVHFQKRRKNTILVILWNPNFAMFPEYIYKSFDIFTKIMIATYKIISNRLEKSMYEGQGHKLSNFKKKKKGIFH